MTAREDLDVFSDAKMLYCKNCEYSESLGELGGKTLLVCTNQGCDEREHVFTEHHLACNADDYQPKKNYRQGKCKKCKEYDYLTPDGVCFDCE